MFQFPNIPTVFTAQLIYVHPVTEQGKPLHSNKKDLHFAAQ